MRLNSITTSRNDRGTILFTAYGADANTAILHHRAELLSAVENGGNNRYFVFEGPILRAAQESEDCALRYFSPGRVLLDAGERQYRVCVQCEDQSTGSTGDFVGRVDVDGKRRAVSPLFGSLAELFLWMKEHGWKLEEYVEVGGERIFVPWRAAKG